MPKRGQLSRQKGFRLPDGAVVVARPSKWGNPYRFTWSEWKKRDAAVARAEVVAEFRARLEKFGWYYTQPFGPRTTVADIRLALKGKDLYCWCPLDQSCHADVLLEIANA